MPNEPFHPLDLSQVRRIPLASRQNKVKLAHFARVGQRGMTVADFLAGLPHQLAAEDFRAVVEAVIQAHRRGKPVLWAMGAHVIKCGLSPLVIELMRRQVISLVAMNGAGAIHDVEVALIGETSEDVAQGLETGLFGMAEETGRLINQCVNEAWGGGRRGGFGMGPLLGRKLLVEEAPYNHFSLLAWGARLKIPVTVHLTLGADVTHMHPDACGGALGAASFHDFGLLAGAAARLGDGGVYFNVGSAVVLPEVFLKALTLARHLGHDVKNFTTVNLDMQQHYRPLQNVVRRPIQAGGKGYALTGHHELLLPLLVQAIIERLDDTKTI